MKAFSFTVNVPDTPGMIFKTFDLENGLKKVIDVFLECDVHLIMPPEMTIDLPRFPMHTTTGPAVFSGTLMPNFDRAEKINTNLNYSPLKVGCEIFALLLFLAACSAGLIIWLWP